MGSILGKQMKEAMEKQQEVMLKQQLTMLERQIQLQNMMRERQVAMQIARSREMFVWVASFATLASFGLLRGFAARRNPAMLGPLLPLSFVVGYQYDLCYGTKLKRIRAEAEHIMVEESDVLHLPVGLPTIAGIDAARSAQKDENRMKSNELFL